MRKIIALVMVYLIISSVLSISVLSAKVEVIGHEMGYRVVMSDGSEFFMAYEGFYRYESEANTVVGHLNRGEDLAVFSALVRILYNRQREHGGLGNRLNYYLEDERTLDKSTSLLIANLIRTYYKQNYVKLSENDVSLMLIKKDKLKIPGKTIEYCEPSIGNIITGVLLSIMGGTCEKKELVIPPMELPNVVVGGAEYIHSFTEEDLKKDGLIFYVYEDKVEDMEDMIKVMEKMKEYGEKVKKVEAK